MNRGIAFEDTKPFLNTEVSVKSITLNIKLSTKIHTTIITLSTGLEINIEKFQEFCTKICWEISLSLFVYWEPSYDSQIFYYYPETISFTFPDHGHRKVTTKYSRLAWQELCYACINNHQIYQNHHLLRPLWRGRCNMTTVMMIRENEDEDVDCYYYSDSEVAEAV